MANNISLESTGQQGSQAFRNTVEQAGANYKGNSRYIAVDADGNVTELGNQLPGTVKDSLGGGGSSGGSSSGAAQKEIPCPFCEGEVLPKQAGRPFQAISGFLQRSFKIRIPTEILTLLQEIMPVSKTAIRKEPETCKACEGKLTIPDPSDDSAKWEQVKANAQARAQEIAELESKLAPACGNRYTLIQGSDLLEVGLGFNDAPSYRVDEGKNVRAGGLLDPSETNPDKGGPIPQGMKANHVQGINSLASPGGHYMIKCANKFSVLAGAQGIELTTGGPLTINSGIVRFTGPELSIGSKTGRLSLEGDVVNLNGKSVEVAPTDGHFFVKGTISNTGNMMCGGHAHLESSSVVKMETTGRNEPSKPSSPGDLYDGPAFWGGLGMEGIVSSLKDVVGLATTRAANPVEAQQIPSLRFLEDTRDKFMALSYNLRPWELLPTGVLLPGTPIAIAGVFPVVGVIASLVPIFNFPHHHAVPNLSHNHETRIPDIDCSSDTAEQLRGKQGGVSSAAPLHKVTGASQNLIGSIFSAITTIFVPVWKGIQGLAGPYAK